MGLFVYLKLHMWLTCLLDGTTLEVYEAIWKNYWEQEAAVGNSLASRTLPSNLTDSNKNTS